MRRQIEQKYDVDIYVSDPIHWGVMRAIGLSSDNISDCAWQPVGRQSPLTIEANWPLPNEIRLVMQEGNAIIHTPAHGSQPALGEDVFVTVTADPKRITLWDLDRIGKEVKDYLRRALKALCQARRAAHMKQPNALTYHPSDQDGYVTIVINLEQITQHNLRLIERDLKDHLRKTLKNPAVEFSAWTSPLAFFRTTSDQKFDQHLRRYDRHFQYGLSYRQIASLEGQKDGGEDIPDNLLPKRMGQPIRGEDSVEDSVILVYQAIYRRRYRARRKRQDMPGLDIPQYSCPMHPEGDCPSHCRYMANWRAKVFPTLPADDTGRESDRLVSHLTA